MIPTPNRKRDLSHAYFYAIAADAQCLANKIDQGNDLGIDFKVSKPEKTVLNGKTEYIDCRPALDFQLKSTQLWSLDGKKTIVYDLDARTYNHMHLRTVRKNCAPLVLCILCLAKNTDAFVCNTRVCLSLHNAMYWYVLPPCSPLSNNKSTVRIKIPVTQLFTSGALCAIMDSFLDKGVV